MSYRVILILSDPRSIMLTVVITQTLLTMLRDILLTDTATSQNLPYITKPSTLISISMNLRLAITRQSAHHHTALQTYRAMAGMTTVSNMKMATSLSAKTTVRYIFPEVSPMVRVIALT